MVIMNEICRFILKVWDYLFLKPLSVVEGLTGKIGTFLLADLSLRYHYDMTV